MPVTVAVDLFAGWGGFSAGAEAAGVEVAWAANHWPLAVEAHAANHPRTRHACQDLRQADWSSLPEFDLLLASPACQGHSQAAQPSRSRSSSTRRTHDALRATALAVVDCADITRPRAIIVENVKDFARWELVGWWCDGLRLLGYTVTTHVVRASHHGVPQRRDRLFIVAMLAGAFTYEQPQEAEPAFGPSIDWDSGRWRELSEYPAASKALARIKRARARCGRRCIVQHVTGHRGLELTEPLRTITTQDQWGIIDGDRYRLLTVRETARGMGFADSYSWPDESTRGDKIKGLGNAVCPPVARDLIEQVTAVM